MNFNSFDESLFKKLCEGSNENENIFFSPLSVSLALSMLLVGSKGETKQQLEKALGIDTCETVLGKLKELNDVLNSNSEGLKINLANSVFPSENFKMTEEYKSVMQTTFNSKVQTLDYKNNAGSCTKTINDWVASRTNENIKN